MNKVFFFFHSKKLKRILFLFILEGCVKKSKQIEKIFLLEKWNYDLKVKSYRSKVWDFGGYNAKFIC